MTGGNVLPCRAGPRGNSGKSDPQGVRLRPTKR